MNTVIAKRWKKYEFRIQTAFHVRVSAIEAYIYNEKMKIGIINFNEDVELFGSADFAGHRQILCEKSIESFIIVDGFQILSC